MNLVPLIPIGSLIVVDKTKIKDNLPKKLSERLPEKIKGKIVDYKMTDGMGIGYTLITERNTKIWFFCDELNDEIINQYKLNEKKMKNSDFNIIKTINDNYLIDIDLDGTKEINFLLNPLNLVKWLVFTIKDVI